MERTEPDPDQTERHIAAVDLGSNSFHMLVARVGPEGQVWVVDRLKERVRLAAGLDEHRSLSVDAQERALACLDRFGDRLRELPRGNVRAVGTSTLRKATNSHTFLIRAKRALGHPIDVVSGHEEARLIHRGITTEFVEAERRLIVDIGGGSTELILGDLRPDVLDSLGMGCVSWTRHFFEGPEPLGMQAAITAARLELDAVKARYQGGSEGWTRAVGSSGTIKAVDQCLRARGEGEITPAGLQGLTRQWLEDPSALEMSAQRREVFAGGLAVLRAVVEGLQVPAMQVAHSALREGALADLVGRFRHDDVRAHTVDAWAVRMNVDHAQAVRVLETATSFFDQVAREWKLLPRHRQLLEWAAQLHEVGQTISWSGYHKHGAYLLQNADLAGFSLQERRLLAAIVLVHRGRFLRERMEELAPGISPRVVRLGVLLRLARDIHRSRTPHPVVPTVSVDGDSIELAFQPGALAALPLLKADLEAECRVLQGAGFGLSLVERSG